MYLVLGCVIFYVVQQFKLLTIMSPGFGLFWSTQRGRLLRVQWFVSHGTSSGECLPAFEENE